MSNGKLITTFKMGDAAFELTSGKIIEAFTGNPNFLTPSPTLKTLNADRDSYSQSLAVAGKGFPKANNILKNEARAVLAADLKALAKYAVEVADGDEAVLATTGFELYKKKQPVGVLPKPADVKVSPGRNKGSLRVSLKKIPKAKFYEIQYAPSGMNGSTVWQTFAGSKKDAEINGLTSGTEYRIKVAGAGANPERVWSDEVTSFVL